VQILLLDWESGYSPHLPEESTTPDLVELMGRTLRLRIAVMSTSVASKLRRGLRSSTAGGGTTVRGPAAIRRLLVRDWFGATRSWSSP